MTRACKRALRELADNWIDRIEDGGDSAAACDRDKRSLLALLVEVYQHDHEKNSELPR